MILLLTGASHTGKTLFAQRLLEQYHYPYLSMDHIKMGLIRSGQTALTPEDDDEMTGFLWPIIREIVKTAIENGQDLIVEGCYVPADWEQDFPQPYRKYVCLRCLVMTEAYLRRHFDEVKRCASAIEQRGEDDGFDLETAIRENRNYLAAFGSEENLILIEDRDSLPYFADDAGRAARMPPPFGIDLPGMPRIRRRGGADLRGCFPFSRPKIGKSRRDPAFSGLTRRQKRSILKTEPIRRRRARRPRGAADAAESKQ